VCWTCQDEEYSFRNHGSLMTIDHMVGGVVREHLYKWLHGDMIHIVSNHGNKIDYKTIVYSRSGRPIQCINSPCVNEIKYEGWLTPEMIYFLRSGKADTFKMNLFRDCN
jgi:hypothetical protein